MTSLRSRVLIARLRLLRRKRDFADLDELYKSIQKSQQPGNEVPPARIYGELHVREREVNGWPLALVITETLEADGRQHPKELVLISPWLDIRVPYPSQPELDPDDPYLAVTGLREAGRLYAGSLDRTDSAVSPIHGPLPVLERVSVFIGTRDVLLADARALRELATGRGIELDYYEYEGMLHSPGSRSRNARWSRSRASWNVRGEVRLRLAPSKQAASMAEGGDRDGTAGQASPVSSCAPRSTSPPSGRKTTS